MPEILALCHRYEALFLPILAFEAFVSLIGTVFLVLEYYFGRPDIAIKNDEKQKKRIRKAPEVIPYEKEMD